MSIDSSALISVRNLKKEFRLGVRLRRVDALKGISFDVPGGAVFGFLGPNGAGKTTTIKILAGLIHSSSGSASIFGEAVGASSVGARLGYLPEQPYFYDYLSGRETLLFYASLFGLKGDLALRRSEELLDRVGLGHAGDRAVRKYSKGMMQRLGIAQALINDPELIILDEPMSGLDPIGRKEVRDLMFELKRAGKTVFFSSHILSDIEMACDRVAIINEGQIIESGSVSDLVARAGDLVEVFIRGEASLEAPEGSKGPELVGDLHRYELKPGSVDSFLALVLESGASIVSVVPRKTTLEDLFVQEIHSHRGEGKGGTP